MSPGRLSTARFTVIALLLGLVTAALVHLAIEGTLMPSRGTGAGATAGLVGTGVAVVGTLSLIWLRQR